MGLTIRLSIRTLCYILAIAMVLLTLDILLVISFGRQKTKVSQKSGLSQATLSNGVKVGGTVPVSINRPVEKSEFSNDTKQVQEAPVVGKASIVVEKAEDHRTMLESPDVPCSAGRSRNRMLNLYGEKFNVSIPPFMNMDFESQPHIQDLPFPFGVQKSASLVKQTLGILSNSSLPDISRRKSCLRCVIVGNGGILKDTSLGKVIDNFDVVLR
jgi:hypothetical protein